MSSVVPFVAAAFLGPIGVALVTLTFAATGMSAKIDKAAANVFGEDLVKIANIAGMAYGIYNGGFQIDGVGTEAVLAERAAATGAEMAASLNAAGYAPEAVAASTGSDMAASLNAAGYGSQAAAGGDMATSLNNAGYGATGVEATAKTGNVMEKLAPPTVAQAPSVPAAAPQAVTSGGATGAAAPGATANITDQALKAQPSFFDKLKGMATDPKFAGEALKGITSGYGQAAAAEAQQAQYDQQRNDRLRRSRIGSFSLKG